MNTKDLAKIVAAVIVGVLVVNYLLTPMIDKSMNKAA